MHWLKKLVKEILPAPDSSGDTAKEKVERCCAAAGLHPFEHIGADGLALHFRDTVVEGRWRKLFVTWGESGGIATFSMASAAALHPRQVTPEILVHVLRRNSELVFPAWQMTVAGTVNFTLACSVLLNGLDGVHLLAIVEIILKESIEFDTLLRESRLI